MFSKSNRTFGRAVVVAFACAAVLFPASVRAEDAGSTSCPVLHNTIEKVTKDTQFSDYKGSRYYFCCDGCKPKFDKESDKYLKDLDARIKAAEQKKAAEPKDKDTNP